jgi:hypothetical protein
MHPPFAPHILRKVRHLAAPWCSQMNYDVHSRIFKQSDCPTRMPIFASHTENTLINLVNRERCSGLLNELEKTQIKRPISSDKTSSRRLL